MTFCFKGILQKKTRSGDKQKSLVGAADHFWWTDAPLGSADREQDFYHPSEYAPHCMPCHWGKEEEQQANQGRAGDMYQPFPPYPGCPCTLQQICKSDKRGLFETSCDAALKPLPIR